MFFLNMACVGAAAVSISGVAETRPGYRQSTTSFIFMSATVLFHQLFACTAQCEVE